MVTAFVLIDTKSGSEPEVLHHLNKKVGNVQEAHLVYGDYRILAKVKVNDRHEVNDLLINEIRKIPGVISTSTMVGL